MIAGDDLSSDAFEQNETSRSPAIVNPSPSATVLGPYLSFFASQYAPSTGAYEQAAEDSFTPIGKPPPFGLSVTLTYRSPPARGSSLQGVLPFTLWDPAHPVEI